MNTLVDMISGMEVKEDDEGFYERRGLYVCGPGKTRSRIALRSSGIKSTNWPAAKAAKSILISCGARLAPFDIPSFREVMAYDELELDRIGDRKTVVFFIISDTTQTYNFLVALAFFADVQSAVYEGPTMFTEAACPIMYRCCGTRPPTTGQVPQLEKSWLSSVPVEIKLDAVLSAVGPV